MSMQVSTRRALAAALAFALSLAATAGNAATPSLGGNGVQLAPAQVAAGYFLRVTGPAGFLFERQFARGEAVGVDAPRSGWIEGVYRYEISAVAAVQRQRSDNEATPAAAAPASESGTFRVQDGLIYLGDHLATRNDSGANSGPQPNDQVIPDDLIVQGSTCVGFDCVNNENFGFDTIRLKENNTRIKFEDTSVGAFPTTDWQLTANDSASGGQNRFSVEDVTAATIPFTVEGAAPTNAVYVDSTGRVGFRTSTPVLDLHVTTGNTPAIRLEQTAASGFTAQTWDIGANEANFFVRDVTSGSRLPFRLRPGAPTSSIDVNATGLVGINTASPSVRLHVNGTDGTTTQVLVRETNATVAARDLLRLENNGPTRLRLKNTATNNEWSFNAHDSELRVTPAGAATVAMTVQTNGNMIIAGTLTQNSDRNSKENFRPLDHKALLQKIASLDITEWNFKSENKDVRHIGPMAQDFHASFGLGEREDRIAPLDTSGVALAAIQGLQQELSERDRRIAELEARLERLDSLTQRLARERVERTAALPASNNCDAQTVAAGL